MFKLKSILIILFISFGWLAAVLVVENMLSPTSDYYQLEQEDINKIELEIRQLQRIEQISSWKFYTKRDFISELERVLGKNASEEIKEMLVQYAEHSTFSRPKILFVLPAVVLCSSIWFFIIRLYYPMSKKRLKYLLWLGIIGGLMSSEAAGYTNLAVEDILGSTYDLTVQQHPIRTFAVFLLCAMGEEFWKFLFCYLLIRRSKIFQKPIDGLVLSMIVGLGFATFENIGYVGMYNYDVLFIRCLLTVPAHLCFSGIWGYGIAEARFRRRKYPFIHEIWPYLALASVVHFIYNYFFSTGRPVFYVFVLGVLLTMILFFHYQLQKKQRLAR
jgi:RsiW-degrading membrane proteinase PrsW (M82 family)